MRNKLYKQLYHSTHENNNQKIFNKTLNLSLLRKSKLNNFQIRFSRKLIFKRKYICIRKIFKLDAISFLHFILNFRSNFENLSNLVNFGPPYIRVYSNVAIDICHVVTSSVPKTRSKKHELSPSERGYTLVCLFLSLSFSSSFSLSLTLSLLLLFFCILKMVQTRLEGA